MTNYYPAFINLCGKQCVVVGGGRVAERKVLSLLNSGAAVKVISPAITDTLKRQKQSGRIKHIKRNYRSGDLKDAFLVIAAASDEDINRKVSEEAPCLVNVVDMPEMANFIVPSVLNRGPMTITVSTSGASPAAARAVRKEIESLYNKNFGQYLNFLKQMRKKIIKAIPDKKARERFLNGVASKEIFNILRENGFKEARQMVLDKLKAEL